MHCFAEPGELPEPYVKCTQGQRQIGQAGLYGRLCYLMHCMSALGVAMPDVRRMHVVHADTHAEAGSNL